MQATVVTLPLPLLAALLCLVLAVLVRRLDLGSDKSPILFSALFALFAVEALLVAVRFGYGVDRFVLLQATLPLLVGPLMYLGFAALALSSEQFRKVAYLHFGAVLVIALSVQLLPTRFSPSDWAVSASYLFYAVALFLLWRKSPDTLIHARLDLARSVTQWILWGVGLLTVMLIFDTAIAISFAMREGGRAYAIISIGSALFILLLITIFFVLPQFLKTPKPALPKPPVGENAQAAQIEADARDLLNKTKLYLCLLYTSDAADE